MSIFYSRAVYFLLVMFTLMVLPACEKQGPLEQAGERVDESIDDAGDQVEEIQEDLQRQN